MGFQNAFNVFMCNIQVYTIVNDILQSCTYILTKQDERGAYLVDCGDIEPIISFIEENNLHLEGVLLTHCHYDHIYGLKDLLLKYPDIKVYAGENTFLGLENDDLSMSYLYSDEEYIVDINKEQRVIAKENTIFNVLSEVVECIPTPGHDVDCMSYVIGRAIFTGDSYNPKSPVFTKWRNSDADEAIRSERLLKDLINNKHLIVYPGHRID